MKFPKQTRTFCPSKQCKKHTMHKIKLLKNKARPKTKKNALNSGARRIFKIMAGYGGMPRAKAATKHKQTTKQTFVYTCSVCTKSHVKAFSRLKKANLV